MIRSALIALLVAVPANAADRALLIGVSQYDPSLGAYAPELAGPPNDVALMHRALSRLGVGEIEVLSDAPPDSAYGAAPAPVASPTRAAIVAALVRLAEVAEPGERVIVYFAGHGTQVAGTDTTEADGADEVLLAADARLGPRGLSGGIRDDDLGALVGAIAARGAFVWLVVDACHSGSLERGSQITPRMLAMPGLRPALLDAPVDVPSGKTAPGGGFAGFYAARPGQVAFEAPMTPGTPVHGLFTWSLSRALAKGAPDLRTLSRTVRAGYWAWGHLAPDPVFSGDLSRRPPGPDTTSAGVFALASEGGTLTVLAGRADGLAPGDVLAIRDDPDAPPLFHATVASAGLTTAALSLAEGWPDRRASLLEAAGLPARMVDLWTAERAPILKAVPAARARPPVRVAADPGLLPDLDGISRVGPSEPAEIALSVEDGMILAALDDGIRSLGAVGSDWTEALARLVRGRRLLATFAGLPVATLDMRLAIAPRPAERPCPAPDLAPPPAEGAGPVTPCDIVVLSLENTGAAAVDVAPFYLSPRGDLHYLTGYREGAWLGLRLDPGAAATVHYAEDPGDDGAGRVHLLILTETVRDPETAPLDLRGLADARRSRGTVPARYARLFGAAGADLTRSAAAAGETGAVILMLDVEATD